MRQEAPAVGPQLVSDALSPGHQKFLEVFTLEVRVGGKEVVTEIALRQTVSNDFANLFYTLYDGGSVGK